MIVLMMKIFPQSLILKRLINDINPSHLESQRRVLYTFFLDAINKTINRNKRVAILITGSMRTQKRAEQFLYNLPDSIDVYICTDSRSYQDALEITQKVILDNFESEIHGAINQWHKLKTGLQLIKDHERENNMKYTHIYKIRTDFYFCRPMLAAAKISYGSNFTATSDKIFGGKRDTMMLFQNFLEFNKRISNEKLIVDSAWITNASDSVKWYGFLLETNDLKGVISVEQLKNRFKLSTSRDSMYNKQEMCLYRKNPDTQSRFFEGGNIFASEIVFAAFLMYQKIIPSYSNCFSGFLYSDRGN